MTNAKTVSVKYYRGLAGLDELRAVWDGLFGSCRNHAFYNDWRWHHALQKHLIPTDIHYVLASKNGEPAAILPLQRIVRPYGPIGVRMLTFPSHVAVDLSDMLVAEKFRDESLLDAIVDKLRTDPPCTWDILQLMHFTERSCLRGQADLHAIPYHRIGHSAYVAGDSSGFGERLAKKQIKNVRRHLRNAEAALGDCSFENAATPEELAARYEVFLKLESSGWKGGEGTRSAIALRPDARAFYGEVLRTFGETGEAVVNVLAFGQQPLAAQIGLRIGDRLSLLKIGFDESFREFGPGAIALLKCLDESAGRLRELSLVTCPPWSERWHFTNEEKYVLELCNRRPYATLLWFALRLRRKTGQALTRLSRTREPKHEAAAD